MDSDPLRDPRYEPLPPTADEIAAWADAERKRREAWLAGPSEEEKAEWSRRYRRRAALGLAESRLPPSAEDVAEWAEREHKRRQAWIAGPAEDEKREWTRSYRRRARTGNEEADRPPTPEEIEAWAEQERLRRQEWLAGPTPEERQRWIRREGGGLWADVLGLPVLETELFDNAHRFLREAELAGKGSFFALARAPMAMWSYFVRAGRRFEEEIYQQPPRGRVRF
jgi:hypothetical protein